MHGGDLTEETFAKFRDLIYKVAGIKIPETKKVMVSNRLRRRLRATGIADFSAYYKFLTSTAGAAEMPLFLNEVTTNETYFYRDVHHFEWLNQTFFPQIAEEGRKRLRPRSLRIWSAAASTGEELYSIKGTPPSLFKTIKGDAFAPRNPQALLVDYEEEPPSFRISEDHWAKTWLLDERAPRIQAPDTVMRLRERLARDARSEGGPA